MDRAKKKSMKNRGEILGKTKIEYRPDSRSGRIGLLEDVKPQGVRPQPTGEVKWIEKDGKLYPVTVFESIQEAYARARREVDRQPPSRSGRRNCVH